MKTLWIIVKAMILLAGLSAILAGGICGAILVPGAVGNDSLARSFLGVAAGVLVVGLALAIPAWRSLRRDYRESRAAQERLTAELLARQAGLPTDVSGKAPE